MTDSGNDQRDAHQPVQPPSFTTSPLVTPPNPTGASPSSTTLGLVDESAWVRSVYLFGACAAGGAMMIAGLLLTIASLVSAIAPDSGLRDGWDRGLVGVTELADGGLALFEEFNQSSLRDQFDDFCDGETEDAFCQDLQNRIDGADSAIPDELSDSISLIRDEVHRQIRTAAIARLIAGLAVAIIGFLLFRFHAKQVSVYQRR